MSAAVICESVRDAAPITLRRDERLAALFSPIRDMSPMMTFVVMGSLALHAIVVATAVVTGRTALTIPKEIAVEVVQEVPKPAPPQPTPPKPATPPPQQPPPKPVAQATPPGEAPKPLPAPPPQAKPAAQDRVKPDSATPNLAKQIENLRAEREALKSQLAADSAEAKAAPSGKAVALAAAGADDGDPVGYQQLVFSQLAKAKDGDGFKGAVGTTGVRFEIAATGDLTDVVVVTPSGDAALDREAVSIVRRAAPFPPPPKDAERSIFANVNFVAPKRP